MANSGGCANCGAGAAAIPALAASCATSTAATVAVGSGVGSAAAVGSLNAVGGAVRPEAPGASLGAEPPPRSAAIATASETTTMNPALRDRPSGTHSGNRSGFRGGADGASAASHAAENGRGSSGREAWELRRPGISLAPERQAEPVESLHIDRCGWRGQRAIGSRSPPRVWPAHGDRTVCWPQVASGDSTGDSADHFSRRMPEYAWQGNRAPGSRGSHSANHGSTETR